MAEPTPETFPTPKEFWDEFSEQGRNPAVVAVLKHFSFDHLPQSLQAISRPFYVLAHDLVRLLPDDPQLTIALQKLLESKDAAVRAALSKQKT
jgi:hypothetical protein